MAFSAQEIHTRRLVVDDKEGFAAATIQQESSGDVTMTFHSGTEDMRIGIRPPYPQNAYDATRHTARPQLLAPASRPYLIYIDTPESGGGRYVYTLVDTDKHFKRIHKDIVKRIKKRIEPLEKIKRQAREVK